MVPIFGLNGRQKIFFLKDSPIRAVRMVNLQKKRILWTFGLIPVPLTGVLEKPRRISIPRRYLLEGSDQYRGWFNSSLIISVAVNGVHLIKELFPTVLLSMRKERKCPNPSEMSSFRNRSQTIRCRYFTALGCFR